MRLSEFTPIQDDPDLTMDGTAQSVELADNVTRVFFINRGVLDEDIRIAFGTSAAAAEAALTISSAAATTGHYIPSPMNGYGSVVLGVPSESTHYAVANAVTSNTQLVSITQGK